MTALNPAILEATESLADDEDGFRAAAVAGGPEASELRAEDGGGLAGLDDDVAEEEGNEGGGGREVSRRVADCRCGFGWGAMEDLGGGEPAETRRSCCCCCCFSKSAKRGFLPFPKRALGVGPSSSSSGLSTTKGVLPAFRFGGGVLGRAEAWLADLNGDVPGSDSKCSC